MYCNRLFRLLLKQLFFPNVALYYTVLIAFLLLKCCKEDVCQEVVPLEAYATALRRQIINIAAKIVRHAGQVILKVLVGKKIG